MQHTLKYTVICLTALAALASCSENDIPALDKATDKYIVFGTPGIGLDASEGNFAGTAETRANVTLATSVNEFKVWAYCIPNTIGGAKDEGKATAPWVEKSKFFTGSANGGADVANLANATVTPLAANNYNRGALTPWNDDSDAQYSFIGIAGQQTYQNYDKKNVNNFEYSMESASAVSGSEHGPKMTITLNPNLKTETTTTGKWPNQTTTTTTKQADRLKQADPLVAEKFNHSRKTQNGNVKLTFFHIMTALRFKFQNFSDKDLIITSMTFNGKFYKKAVLDFTSTTHNMSVDVNETYEGPFYVIDQNTTQTIAKESAAYAGGDDNYLLLLPNPEGTTNAADGKYFLGEAKKITITYRFDGDKTDRPPFVLDNFILNYQPKSGTKHTVYLNFVGDKFTVTFQPDEKTWEVGSNNEYTIK